MNAGKLTKERLEKFCRILSAIEKIIAIIITHRDPDSMACAKIFAAICKAFGKTVQIFYKGKLEDEQNRCIWNGFNLGEEFLPVEIFLQNPEKYDVVILDAPPEDTRLGIDISPIIIIDHHPNIRKLEEPENRWYFIEPSGAAVTHVVDIFLKLDKPELKFDSNEDLATLAVIGLLADADLRLIARHTTNIDRELFHIISQYADLPRAEHTFNTIYTEEYNKYHAKALNNRLQIGNIVITNIGLVSSDNLALAARFADKLYLTEGIDIVIVSETSLPDYETHIKLRSMSDRNDLTEYIRKRFGNGGARNGKGAAQIPPPPGFYLPNTSEAKEKYIDFITQQIKDKVMNPLD